MSFSYSGDPSISELDRLRFQVGDTDSNMPILQDEEINYIIMQSSNVLKQQAMAFRQMATALGIKAAKRSLGPQTEDTTKRLEYYSRMADYFENQQKYAGVPPTPDYASEKVFFKGMMTNEE